MHMKHVCLFKKFENWQCYQFLLRSIKHLLELRHLFMLKLISQQIFQWCYYTVIIPNKFYLVSSISLYCVQSFHKYWGRQIEYDYYLGWVDQQTLLAHNMFQHNSKWCIENVLLHIERYLHLSVVLSMSHKTCRGFFNKLNIVQSSQQSPTTMNSLKFGAVLEDG